MQMARRLLPRHVTDVSRISYHDISRNNELDEKPDILTDLALSLSDFKITKKELIFQNYLTYMEYSSQRDAFHFIPKTINLMCSFESLKSKSYAKALQLLPLCQVSRKYDAITRYRRPCQLNYILICRCKDGQNEEEHLHNACLGQNFSQNRDYRYQLWDNQADMKYIPSKLKKGKCMIFHQSPKHFESSKKWTPTTTGRQFKNAYFACAKLFADR